MATSRIFIETPKNGCLDALQNVSRETYGFAIAVIACLGGLVVFAVGAAAYAGSLSNIVQIDAIAMMSAGGGGVFIIGSWAMLKNCSNVCSQNSLLKSSEAKEKDSGNFKPLELYGPRTWDDWGVEIIETVPKRPDIKGSTTERILIYIPRNIKWNGNPMELTDVDQLSEIFQLQPPLKEQLKGLNIEKMSDPPTGRWVLIDKAVLPESRGLSVHDQLELVVSKGCKAPTLFLMVIVTQMVLKHTGVRLYGSVIDRRKNIVQLTYTLCTDKCSFRSGYGDTQQTIEDHILFRPEGYEIERREVFPLEGEPAKFVGVIPVRYV